MKQKEILLKWENLQLWPRARDVVCLWLARQCWASCPQAFHLFLSCSLFTSPFPLCFLSFLLAFSITVLSALPFQQRTSLSSLSSLPSSSLIHIIPKYIEVLHLQTCSSPAGCNWKNGKNHSHQQRSNHLLLTWDEQFQFYTVFKAIQLLPKGLVSSFSPAPSFLPRGISKVVTWLKFSVSQVLSWCSKIMLWGFQWHHNKGAREEQAPGWAGLSF